MAIEQVERSLFRGRELSAKKLTKGDVLFIGLKLFPLIEEFVEITPDLDVKKTYSSDDGAIMSEDIPLKGEEINRARIKTKRTRPLTRRPILRYTP